MIRLTRFCGDPVFVNSDQIEIVEQTPDTVLILVTGNRLTVRETPEQIAGLIRDFRRSLTHVYGVKLCNDESIDAWSGR